MGHAPADRARHRAPLYQEAAAFSGPALQHHGVRHAFRCLGERGGFSLSLIAMMFYA